MQVGHVRSASADIALWGCFLYLAFLGSFGFYAYARIGHTVSGHLSAGLVIYEIIVLAAEALIFASSAQYGLIHVRPHTCRCWMSGHAWLLKLGWRYPCLLHMLCPAG